MGSSCSCGRIDPENAVSIYYQAIPLKANKQVEFVTLPDVSQGVTINQTAMHIFAISIG